MPRGNLWAIYAILQFINGIIVTLHFLCRSKLFYFSKFFNFDFRLWIRRVDIVGVGIIKNSLSLTGGPGGRPSPPRLWKTNPRVCPTRIQKNCSFYNLLSTMKVLVGHPLPFLIFCEKTKFYPKMAKTWKNTKIVGMTSYSQGRLCQNSAPQKYWFLIFVTNEGDFGGTLVKNQ